jgi:predicted Zn-dependent protease
MLTPDMARDRAHDIVSRARAAGADAADAVLGASASVDVSVRLGALEDVGRSEEEELGLRVFVGRRSASVSTSDLSSDAMDALVERAVAMAREAPEDQWAGLAPEERLLKGNIPDLDLHDGDEPSPASLKEAALAAEDAARAVPGVTNSEGGGASASRIAWALATSHGFAGAYATTSHGIQASVLAGGGADAMVRDYAYHSARHRAHLDAPDPHRPHGLRSRPFDGEGLPVSPTDIVRDGVLQTWLLESASARQLSMEPTGHAVRGGSGAPGVGGSNTYLAPGLVSRDDLFAGIARGVYVTELIGMGVNGVTGDYSRGAAGFLIENGEITSPVDEFTIAGNLKDMFLNLTAANDLEFRYATNVPTLRVDGMTVAGG